MIEEPHLKRLKWRCRRGIKELDLLLDKCFSNLGPDLCDEELNLLDNILQANDLDLYDWFTGKSKPTDAKLSEFMNKLIAKSTT